MLQEKPKFYKADFKESAVKLVNESSQLIAKTARDIGVNLNTLHTWISKYRRAVDNTNATRTDDHLYEKLKLLKKRLP
jgi:transposase